MVWLGPFLAALATGGFLFVQQRRADAREDTRRTEATKEREKDRQHALAMASQERRHALSDAWREHRKTMHVELYAALTAYRGVLENLIVNRRAVVDRPDEWEDRIHHPEVRVGEAISAVKLFGSAETAVAAEQAQASLDKLQNDLFFAFSESRDYGKMHDEAAQLVESYVQRARKELETD